MSVFCFTTFILRYSSTPEESQILSLDHVRLFATAYGENQPNPDPTTQRRQLSATLLLAVSQSVTTYVDNVSQRYRVRTDVLLMRLGFKWRLIWRPHQQLLLQSISDADGGLSHANAWLCFRILVVTWTPNLNQPQTGHALWPCLSAENSLPKHEWTPISPLLLNYVAL